MFEYVVLSLVLIVTFVLTAGATYVLFTTYEWDEERGVVPKEKKR